MTRTLWSTAVERAGDPEPAEVNVVIVDDHAVVRQGLRLVLDGQPGLHVIGEAGDLEPAIELVARRRPHILVLDVNLPSGPSLPAIGRFLEAAPGMRVVVLTMQDDASFAREALRSGASGYVVKEGAAQDLVAAVRDAAAGRAYVSPQLAARMALQPEAAAEAPDGLTEREQEILSLLAVGHTNSEVAERLYLSVRTVETHRAHIQQKTGCTTRAEVFRYAVEHRLVPPQDRM
jgi:two-component system response regulator NreC